MYPREVVKEALRLNAAAVFFSHNHPSGHPEPSEADKALTRRLKQALELVDVRTLDHVIVAGHASASLTEHGLVQLKRGRKPPPFPAISKAPAMSPLLVLNPEDHGVSGPTHRTKQFPRRPSSTRSKLFGGAALLGVTAARSAARLYRLQDHD